VNGRAAIFYYHSVGGPPPQTLPLADFRRHLEAIRHHGYRAVTVSALVASPEAGRVALAFDDGLLDNYTNVLPLLVEFGFQATFYVVPGYDGVTRFVHPDNGRWADEPRPGYTIPFENMRASHRRELVSLGMEVGSHSVSHRMLTHIPFADVRDEVRRSKRALEQELGVEIPSFCYPRGRFNQRVIDEVRAAGYRTACSTRPGYVRRHGNPFRLNRFLIEDPNFFEDVLVGNAFRPDSLARQAVRRLRRLAFRPSRSNARRYTST
jgi:peptidoglycan/xylan/chitin deacetylase (PgdA/CDA1 family)